MSERRVGGVGGGDDDELDGLVNEHRFQAGVGGDLGIDALGDLAVALDDGDEREAVDGGDQGSVEDAAGHSKADETDTDHEITLTLAGLGCLLVQDHWFLKRSN